MQQAWAVQYPEEYNAWQRSWHDFNNWNKNNAANINAQLGENADPTKKPAELINSGIIGQQAIGDNPYLMSPVKSEASSDYGPMGGTPHRGRQGQGQQMPSPWRAQPYHGKGKGKSNQAPYQYASNPY